MFLCEGLLRKSRGEARGAGHFRWSHACSACAARSARAALAARSLSGVTRTGLLEAKGQLVVVAGGDRVERRTPSRLEPEGISGAGRGGPGHNVAVRRGLKATELGLGCSHRPLGPLGPRPGESPFTLLKVVCRVRNWSSARHVPFEKTMAIVELLSAAIREQMRGPGDSSDSSQTAYTK